MKLSKLFSLMKQRKRITVSQGMTAQWVGDGTALYPIYNLPQLTGNTMRTLLDLTDDAWDKYTFEEHNAVHVSEEDFEEGQVQLEPARLSIRWNGVEYLPLMGGGKIYYIQEKYLKPFADDILLTFALRKGALGGDLIGVNEGMCLAGLVMPIVVDDRVFIETLYRVYELTKRQAGEET